MCEKTNVVAGLTVTHRNGQQTIVEVRADASFNQFYHWYKRAAGQDEKHLTRTSNRIDARDLEHLAANIAANWKALASNRVARGKWNGHLVSDYVVDVLDPETYAHLLECDPSELPGGGMGQSKTTGFMTRQPARTPERLPIGYTPLQKRMDIITGRA